MTTLIFDPFAGISGDMTLAALLDVGLDEAWLRGFVRDLGIGDVTVHIESVNRRGIRAPHVRFQYPPEHAHRHLRHVVEIIDRSNASGRSRELAKDAFHRVAVAEAKVHGTTVEKVHFHEVGATDAILDILCVMAAVETMGFTSFFTRPVAVGSGYVDIAHGRYPVPAPATLDILRGIPLTGTDLTGECTTPTGAAILATLTGGSLAPAHFAAARTGFGAGTRDPEGTPNVLRLILADIQAADGPGNHAGATPRAQGGTSTQNAEAPGHARSARLWMLQCDIDDMSPEYMAAAQASLLEAGALDAVLFPVMMKKGRVGTRLEVLCAADRLFDLERVIFTATSTIGVRRWEVERTMLERECEETQWHGQRIRWKRVRLPDGTSRAKPEYEDITAASRALGLTPWEVRTGVEAGRIVEGE